MHFSTVLSILPVIAAVVTAQPAAPLPRLECRCICGQENVLSLSVTKQLCLKSIALAGGDTSIMSLASSGACSFHGSILGYEDTVVGIMDGMKENCKKTNEVCEDIKCSFWSKDGKEEDFPTGPSGSA